MNKRKGVEASIDSLDTKKSKHWSLGLVASMNDPNAIVKKTEQVAVIRDKYPKAKLHYLILPYKNINSIFKLTIKHVPLLELFGELYKELKEEADLPLVAGFHAIPSMQRLHMHVISTDMISPCMKKKIHWNSFTTKFFVPYEELLQELKETGSIKKIPPDLHKSLMATDLQCNQCSYKPKNMPDLKEHILTHLRD